MTELDTRDNLKESVDILAWLTAENGRLLMELIRLQSAATLGQRRPGDLAFEDRPAQSCRFHAAPGHAFDRPAWTAPGLQPPHQARGGVHDAGGNDCVNIAFHKRALLRAEKEVFPGSHLPFGPGKNGLAADPYRRRATRTDRAGGAWGLGGEKTEGSERPSRWACPPWEGLGGTPTRGRSKLRGAAARYNTPLRRSPRGGPHDPVRPSASQVIPQDAVRAVKGHVYCGGPGSSHHVRGGHIVRPLLTRHHRRRGRFVGAGPSLGGSEGHASGGVGQASSWPGCPPPGRGMGGYCPRRNSSAKTSPCCRRPWRAWVIISP